MLVLGLLAVLIADTAAAPEQFALVLAQEPHHRGKVSAQAVGFGLGVYPASGARIVALSPTGIVSSLTPDFASASDPSLSFDGTKILFSGRRRPEDPWNIWEMGIDGANKRQLTTDFGNCVQPRYLATSSITPPDFEDKVRWITYVSDGAGELDELGGGLSTALYAQNTEPIQNRGIVRRRCTFNLSSDFSPTVLSDGRVVFTSRQPAMESGASNVRFPLFVSNWDGTVLNVFVSGYEGGLLKSMACEMPDRTLVFVESDGEASDGSGNLARVSFKRPLHSREVLSNSTGRYRSPNALPDGRLLVSYARGSESLGIYLFDFENGTVGRRLHFDDKWDDVRAVPIGARGEPQGLLSAVVDSETTADLQCMNVYDSDLPGAGEIKKGDVKRVRFIEGVPRSAKDRSASDENQNSPYAGLRILGEVPVEPDGSFYVRLPADTPFRLQTLNSEGLALQTQPGWIWVRRGTSRGCIGCHENKELAPENRATEALKRVNPHVLVRSPQERRKAADFVTSVRPILESRCASCHAGATAAGGLSLQGVKDKDWELIFRRLAVQQAGSPGTGDPLVMPGSARRSRILALLFGSSGSPNTDGHHPQTQIDSRERQALIEWIDLGARWEN